MTLTAALLPTVLMLQSADAPAGAGGTMVTPSPPAVETRAAFKGRRRDERAIVRDYNRAWVRATTLGEPRPDETRFKQILLDAEYARHDIQREEIQTAAAAATEIFSILTEIAIERAKQRGLAVLEVKVRGAVCSLEYSTGSKVLPNTCRLLETTSLTKLAGDPEALRPALFDDLLHGVAHGLAQKLGKQGNAALRPIIEMVLDTVAHSVANREVTFSQSDVDLILDALLAYHRAPSAVPRWNGANGVAVGLQVATSITASIRAGLPYDPIPRLVRDSISPGVVLTEADVRLASEIAAAAARALILGRDDEHPPIQQRLVAATHMVFLVSRGLPQPTTIDRRDLDNLERVIVATIEQNAAAALGTSAQLLLDNVFTTNNAKESNAISKTTIFLSTLASYAATSEADQTAEELREARKEVLEGMIDSATIRSNRHGDVVFSLGIPVGVTTGYQWVRRNDGTKLSGEAMYPQLSLPFGLAAQLLPGRAYRNGTKRGCAKKDTSNCRPRAVQAGAHAMLTAIDLGQFAAYEEDGELNRPRWDTMLSPGLQLGVILGSPEHNFVIGPEVRYAPRLFAADNGADVEQLDHPGGALRFGLSLSYYVSIFDFN